MPFLACAPAPQPAPPPPEPVAAPAPRPPERLPAGPFRRELAPGLAVAAFDPPEVSDPGFSRPDPAAIAATDRRIFVVTVDPARYEVVVGSVLDPSWTRGALDAAGWAESLGLEVAWNPGMFEPDGRATGHARAGALVLQPEVRRPSLYRAWFVAGPLRDGLPAAATLDRPPPPGDATYVPLAALPQDFAERLSGYAVVFQSLAILRDGRPAYPPRENQWSELAYGTDREGRIVVVFSRYPYEMRELGARVAALGIGLDALLHGEGGPEASLAVRAGGVEDALAGSYETGFMDDGNRRLWALPSVMGVRPRR